ncbi:hypothetical protein DUNSADRAFT_9643 [Dunaliella salina]|uniref:GAF domain-containing protein n=1 Tax=Dunaliella salina TaxID=3046 RepID=A0ABQ7GH17_DUNSA|nr:hypothetical protein DUNSADRAFT_9643 [Dunaliella salina]|eukprot:KAF5833896.1 hypothetical protein DUNSADRAFT_9643 [Dunaliella salina]
MGCFHSDLAGSSPQKDLDDGGVPVFKQLALEDLATSSKASDTLDLYRQLNASKTSSAFVVPPEVQSAYSCAMANSRFGGVGKDTKQMLRCLAALKGPPLEQLGLSVGVLQDILELPFVSISVLSQEPTLTSTVVAVSPNMQQCVSIGVPMVIQQAEDIADLVTSTHYIMSGQDFLEACSPFAASMTGIEEAADLSGMFGYQPLPPDWQALSEATDMHAFAAVPIMHKDIVVGQLTVGDSQELCMSSTGANLRHNLEVAATWMSQWVQEGTIAGLAGMLHNITSAGDMEALVQSTCTGLQEYFKKRMQLKLRVR